MNLKPIVQFGMRGCLVVIALLSLTGFAQTTYYVDGGWGSNAWDGLTAIYTNGHGPKLNVSNTISAASSGDTLSIAPGFYQEFAWSPGSKTLTLIPQGVVTIYDTNPAFTDTDGDGMPDQWEAKYGLNGFDPDDADGDLDSDTITNLTEYQQGTDPTNPDTTPPTLTATITPTPSANGWNTNNVVVEFSAVDSESGVAYVTPDVTVTNEAYGQLIEGIAVDNAGNETSEWAMVSIDKTPPTLTGSPADNDVICQTKPPFVIEYSDESSGVDASSLQVTLDGTNVTANLQSFAAGAIWTPTNDLAPGVQHNWTISIADRAGKLAEAEAAFTISAGNPVLTNFNIGSVITVPDIAEIWFQGDMSSTNLTIGGSINFGEPFEFSLESNHFGGFVPLDFGTNVLVVTVSEDTTNVLAYAFMIIRSTSFTVAITQPGADFFANGQPTVISGYASALIDSGLPLETNLVSVTINGIAATLDWNNVDENGNVPFTTSQAVTVATNGSWTAITATIAYANNVSNAVPLGADSGYEYPSKHTREESFLGEFQQLFWPPCGDTWWVEPNSTIEDLTTYAFSAPSGSYSQGDYSSHWPSTTCVEEPVPAGIGYNEVITNNVQSGTTNVPSLAMKFGYTSGETLIEYYSDGVIDSRRLLMGRTLWPTSENSITFRTPKTYKPERTVLFTFEGMSYATVPGQEMNLTNVFWNFNGVANTALVVTANSVTYAVTVLGDHEYTLNEGSFTWPNTTNSVIITNTFGGGAVIETTKDIAHRLSFSSFHNDLDVAGVLYAETANIFPALKPNTEPHIKNWDPASIAKLHEGRVKVAGAIAKRRGEGFKEAKRPTAEQLKWPAAQAAWTDCKAAAKEGVKIDVKNCKHMFQWISDDNGQTPTTNPRWTGDQWPYGEVSKITFRFGPFRVIDNSGQVPISDRVYIFIYCGVQ